MFDIVCWSQILFLVCTHMHAHTHSLSLSLSLSFSLVLMSSVFFFFQIDVNSSPIKIELVNGSKSVSAQLLALSMYCVTHFLAASYYNTFFSISDRKLGPSGQSRQRGCKCSIGRSFLRVVQWCIQQTRLTLVCEMTWRRLVQIRRNLSTSYQMVFFHSFSIYIRSFLCFCYSATKTVNCQCFFFFFFFFLSRSAPSENQKILKEAQGLADALVAGSTLAVWLFFLS